MSWARGTLAVAAPLLVAAPLAAVVVVVMVGAVAGAVAARRPAPTAGVACGAVTGRAPGLEPAQERNAAIITGVGLGRGLGRTGTAIGVAVALAESTLFNYANDGTSTLVGRAEGRQLTAAERAVAAQSLTYPHDRVGNNLDSIGLFQQRPMTGWGTPEQLIDPVTSAGLFYDRLQRVPGWQVLPPWQAGQIVQGSASPDGGIYRDTYERAVGIVAQLVGPTPVAAQLNVPAGPPGSCVRAASGEPALSANGSGGGSARWGGYQNGRIPANALCPVPSRPVLLLDCTAAAGFDAMNTAFQEVFGQDIGITDGYRSLDGQVACRAEKGSLCADPGTSNHGWGRAVDIGGCCAVNTGSGPAFDWLTANAGGFGWVHPAWARPGGSKPEPWHWEFGSLR